MRGDGGAIAKSHRDKYSAVVDRLLHQFRWTGFQIRHSQHCLLPDRYQVHYHSCNTVSQLSTSLHHPLVCTMASDGPDPQSLKSWHDAFQYPIPTVRRVEQELRRDIASNKEKLRSLVGYDRAAQLTVASR